MPYSTSVERIGNEKGIQQGIEKGEHLGEANAIARLVTKRYGPSSAETQARLRAATLE